MYILYILYVCMYAICLCLTRICNQKNSCFNHLRRHHLGCCMDYGSWSSCSNICTSTTTWYQQNDHDAIARNVHESWFPYEQIHTPQERGEEREVAEDDHPILLHSFFMHFKWWSDQISDHLLFLFLSIHLSIYPYYNIVYQLFGFLMCSPLFKTSH